MEVLELEQPRLIRELPLLMRASKFYEDVDLEGTLLICVQHLYSTTYNMFFELFKKGLSPKNLFLIGKCYSTDVKVSEQLIKDGAHLSKASNYFDSHEDYDKTFRASVETLFKEFLSAADTRKYKKIILLDDGGTLISIANKMIPKHQNITCIEQTSSGYNRVRRDKLFFPIINVARSWIKIKYESPIIINLAISKLKERIKCINPKPQSALIMGFGVLGQCIGKQLESMCPVSYFDLDPNRSMFSIHELRKKLSSFDLIVGTTGETSISANMFTYLKPPVTLASLSSSDREFDAVTLRKKQTRTNNCHTDLHIEGVNLLNCGFPINFDSDHAAIDSDEFQLTRAIILGSVCQACELVDPSPGFIELDNQLQKSLEEGLLEYER